MPSTKPDVFISYAHLSNRDDKSGFNGWVAQFHRDLNDCLTERLGREARVWRDNKLRFGSVFGNEIKALLRESKVLLCVLAPTYVESEWCMKELREFHGFATENANLAVEHQSRIITVVKSPVPPGKFPAELSDSLYCEFFDKTENAGGTPRTLRQQPGEYGYDKYTGKVEEIAWAIENILAGLGGEEEGEGEKTVYLAETPRKDCADERKKIKGELEARGLTVLPPDEEPLPSDDLDEYVETVRKYLRRSFMSIHLMGQSYGALPAGEEKKSTVYLQNELAAEHYKGHPQFKRLIWIDPEATNPEPRQAAFLEYLRKDEEAQAGALALLQNKTFGKLVERIQQLLLKPKEKPQTDSLIRIYLMCDKKDDDSVDPVGRFLYDKGYEVIPPPEAEEEGRYIEYHKKSLLKCDATLTIYGKAEFAWVEDRHDDVVTKAKGWGREGGVYCEAILRTPPETRYKKRLFFQPVKLLSPCYHELPCEGESPWCAALTASLNEFINELEKALQA
ncbi:MAG: TIR domain-containing protein [Acidobacteriota bacterium]|nr:TIR domain-containing protein [Acidobacteriota bacterium]